MNRADFIQHLTARRGQFIQVLMLELLHFSIWQDIASPVSRSLMLMHLGFFLIWQPIWRHDEKMSWRIGFTFILLALLFVGFITWWLIFAWLILLTSFAGGRIIVNQSERYNYMIILIFLTSELAIECAPRLFDINLSNNIRALFSTFLPMLPVALIFLPPTAAASRIQSVDILHALTTSMLITVLIFGSLLNMYLGGTEYLTSLFQSLLAFALFLFAISLLLSPKAGFSGLSQLWTNSLLNIGTPFEQWLTDISILSSLPQSPAEFLDAAMDKLASLSWVAGVSWNTNNTPAIKGSITRHDITVNGREFNVHIYAHYRVGGSLRLHCHLLVQLIENYYIAKLRERKLTQQTHIQAIYETGARITHDIKNILQSLQAITSIIEKDKGTNNTASQRLLEKQIPHLTQRLRLALDKLQEPEKETKQKLYLGQWWRDLINRNQQYPITFKADISSDPLIPADLFDSVVENLLENLREKMRIETDLEIKITLFADAGDLSLTICDNGTGIPDHFAKSILSEPLKSNNGLGIGLYQAAKQARTLGYSLVLKENSDGNVCFELTANKQEG